METISIELADEMTLGQLRDLARGMRKRLVISFESDGRAGGPKRSAQAQGGEAPDRQRTKGRRRRRRKLSPEARAALARNLVKARAARSAKAKTNSPKRERKGATPPA